VKGLIQEEFDDIALERQPDAKGDRVKITMSGKFPGLQGMQIAPAPPPARRSGGLTAGCRACRFCPRI